MFQIVKIRDVNMQLILWGKIPIYFYTLAFLAIQMTNSQLSNNFSVTVAISRTIYYDYKVYLIIRRKIRYFQEKEVARPLRKCLFNSVKINSYVVAHTVLSVISNLMDFTSAGVRRSTQKILWKFILELLVFMHFELVLRQTSVCDAASILHAHHLLTNCRVALPTLAKSIETSTLQIIS